MMKEGKNMMKKPYFTPGAVVLSFSADDIVRTSIAVGSGAGDRGDVRNLNEFKSLV